MNGHPQTPAQHRASPPERRSPAALRVSRSAGSPWPGAHAGHGAVMTSVGCSAVNGPLFCPRPVTVLADRLGPYQLRPSKEQGQTELGSTLANELRRAGLQLLHVADIRPVVKVSLVPTPNFQPQRSSSDRPLMPPGGGAGAYTQADKLPTSTGAMVPKQLAGPAAARGAPRRASPTQRRRPPGRYVARDLPARRALRRRAS